MAIERFELLGVSTARQVLGTPSAPSVLLLHGWGGAIESLQAVAQALSERGFCAHTLDLPGFGRSQVPPETWGVADYARWAIAYCDWAGLERVHWIGHSFGGRLSIVIGAEFPERVQKIVLANSAGVLNPPNMRDKLVKAGKALLRLPVLRVLEQPMRTWARNALGSDDLKAAGALEPIFRRVVAEDLLPYAARIAAPTLLIWGDQDQVTPLWQAHKLEQTIPDAGLVIFQGAGHFAYQERLPEFVRIVETFFKGS
ncbi:MAG: alpha/beta hydrolase [Candidatus Thermofonsia Clade 1 bacterium]|jgi:pimeloyl-ACP methyl ester carboxylesterase|uniref:Alpha/beta hydrolase n=1 Tax=Candidatus Thermofonsia Clade 1 bacterium TaxID=2364210 RepID=A0A2M8PIT3_9CHLR|nr:MAG: alpha/beta hydrolase [Candidatus Thermofonsia Clade 1 bacterium]PJF42234.1 MAG: alpha/beta hydrolase [Candidatus Thermofonsia Clade 1 bacterium]RMF53914.1 MAG: alpha/beta hydrolase [Chloroflexota bacterium]